ncbi:hypothetical protein BBB_0707 [Bifidobacterium bifidum BGN4]|uniref:Uncharacterized protein n=1 Tax=Bifidobacterium bifidum BGN4 TaxID=484020 RepID=I3WHD8_BIFBI|nr:hypothetical protein BBB_0707 [Bifidobacterium bifidum BGN4]
MPQSMPATVTDFISISFISRCLAGRATAIIGRSPGMIVSLGAIIAFSGRFQSFGRSVFRLSA